MSVRIRCWRTSRASVSRPAWLASLEWLGATLTKDFAGLNASAHWDRSRGPYPGLRSFEAGDAGVFFGRDEAVGDVIKRLEDLEMTSHGNLLALIGPSGSGKSSLVKAGVLPRLVGPRWGVDRGSLRAWKLSDGSSRRRIEDRSAEA